MKDKADFQVTFLCRFRQALPQILCIAPLFTGDVHETAGRRSSKPHTRLYTALEHLLATRDPYLGNQPLRRIITRETSSNILSWSSKISDAASMPLCPTLPGRALLMKRSVYLVPPETFAETKALQGFR